MIDERGKLLAHLRARELETESDLNAGRERVVKLVADVETLTDDLRQIRELIAELRTLVP
jgi:chromosome segregation ATPase